MRLRRLLFPFVTSSRLTAPVIEDVYPKGSQGDRIDGHDYNMKEGKCKSAGVQKSRSKGKRSSPVNGVTDLIIYLYNRSPAFFAVYLHFPLVGFDKVFDDSKAETGASQLP